MDLPAVQRFTNQANAIDRVDLFIPEGPARDRMKETLARLEQLDPQQWTWMRSDEQRQATQAMTAAFRMNLTILSGLSLIVGLYLILQALEAAVVRRRSEIGTLRALGLTPQWIQRMWLLESVILGSIGSGIGLLLGWLLAQGTVQAISRTVNALYMNTTATAARWDTQEATLAAWDGITRLYWPDGFPQEMLHQRPPFKPFAKSVWLTKTRFNHTMWGLILAILAWLTHFSPPVELAVGNRFPLGGYLSALFALTGAAMLSGSLLRSAPTLSPPSAPYLPIFGLPPANLGVLPEDTASRLLEWSPLLAWL